MRIILETGLGKGAAEYGNMGDVSMLQVAVARLSGVFPEASLEVLTDSSANLSKFCPRAKALDNLGRKLWFGDGILLGRYSKIAPGWSMRLLVGLKRTVRSRWPKALRCVLSSRLRYRRRQSDIGALRAFTHAMEEADLLVICGAGGFYEGCRGWSLEVLDLVEAAIEKGVPVAMLGQGFGPVTDPVVLERAKIVLPRVSLITLRGNRGGLALLRRLGVIESRVQTTGDEAIELAYESRSEEPGQALGINLRFGGSAGTDEGDIENIRPVLQEFITRHKVSALPLPIAIHQYSRDDLAIKRLLAGLDNQSDGGATLDSPLRVINQTARCRVVVTGAYHAAVFALAQGIPVVGLAKSAYFADKLLGLEDQFGVGCENVLLHDGDLPRRLNDAIESAWQGAGSLRLPLQAAALRQINLSRKAYEQVKDLVACGRFNSVSVAT